MSFFYDLNKKLDSIRATPEVTHKQLNERDMSRAAKGYEKYGKEGMEALAKAGREGKDLDKVRDKYNKYDNKEVDEGLAKMVKKVGKALTGGSDKDQLKNLQQKMGVPQTGKKPEQKTTEAAKYRDPKYKDKLYTVEPLDYTYGPDADELYYNPKPDDYEGRKRKIGGGEFSHNDPLRKGWGRGGASNSINTHGKRKGMPSRDQISSLKGSIKDAHGTHAEPNLPEAGAPMTAKQKSFAKLAPPEHKITFADKIAGAKKEVDEMLGDVAAEAMRKALGGGKGRNAEMDEERSKGTAFDMSTKKVDTPKAGSIERGAKHDIKHSTSDPRYTGRTVTRRTDAQGISVGADDDDADTQAGPRGRGRPKGTKGAIGAKGPSGQSKLMTKEGADQGQAQQIVDDLAELRAAAKQAQRGGEFPQGFASKLEVVLYAAMTLIKNQQPGDAQVREEEKTSTRDDRAEKAGKKVTKDIEYDEKEKDNIHGKKRGAEDAKAEKAGKKVAKDIEHDEKKKEKEVDESTTAGSVATSTATKGSGSMVGKGIYDSMNRELENMIAESMTINMSDSTEGGKSLTITATDEDALKLGMLLKSAGLGGGDQHGGDMHSHGEQPCDTCGMPNCGCGDVQEAVDENAPDYPTNTEQANNNFGYADGLDGPKSTGQSIVPVLASQDERQHSYAAEEEDAIKRMMEMAGIKQAELEPWKETMKEEDEDFFHNPNVPADKQLPATPKEIDVELDEEVEEDFLESIQRMREIAGIQEAKKANKDYDGDGKLETGAEEHAGSVDKAIKKAQAEKKVDESIFALNNQWQAYKG